MSSIRARLLAGLLLGALICTLLATYLVYRLADYEADEQSDLRLRQVASSLPVWQVDQVSIPDNNDPDDYLLVQVWNAQQRQIYLSDPAQALAHQSGTGYRTITARGARWRVYAEQRAGCYVQVAQPIAARKLVAARMALRIVPPLLLLLPALAAIIWVVVGRALAPLERMARAVRGRSPSALQALELDGLPPDLLPIALSLNALLQQIDGAMSAQRNFVADAAHELRSPLTALKLQLQLAERAEDASQRAISFGKLHERLERTIHLVQQLLTLARHEQQPVAAARTPLDLLALTRQVVGDHAIYAENKAIDLGITLADGDQQQPLWIVAHADGLQVMLSNLVDNALRYTPHGGRVDVQAGLQDGRPYLSVLDNGPGVSAPERERLFDRFYRPDGNVVWGSGLGMSIVKQVVDAHAAEISLDDNPLGSGLLVSVRLPASVLQ